MSVSIHQFVVLCFFMAVAWAAVGDLRAFRIPNRLVLLVIGFYPAHLIASPQPVDWLAGLICGAVVFFAGFFAFSRGIIGGGDVKLLAAIALWAGPHLVFPVLLLTMMSGGLLALIFLAHAMLQSRSQVDGAVLARRGLLAAPVPYGIAIAIGAAYLTGRLLLNI
ncbi:A24 family peptidase [Desertibaculum subflavum]|uniref:A24 family peptidase n=1 Tax=Desertibaculum subflavum TaxID=2268458 RepID=UPI000E66B670